MRKIYRNLTIAVIALFALSGRAENLGFEFGYCSDNISGVGNNAFSNYWIAGAFQMTAEDVESFGGCEVTGVNIGFGSGRNKEVTVFFTYDLKEAPFAIQTGRVRANSWCEIALTTPFKIEKGKPFYVCYKYNANNSTAMPVGTDGNTAAYTPTADWISISETEDGLSGNWKNYGSSFGNVSLRVFVKGDNLPTHNCLPVALRMPQVAFPGEEFDFSLDFSNASTTDVNSLEVEYQIGDDPVVVETRTLSPAVEANKKGTVTFKAVTDQDSYTIPVKARILKVNGEANALSDKYISTMLVCTGGLFERKVVAEKITGTGCGYCPIGIVAFEHVARTQRGKFIGIAVHSYYSDAIGWPDNYKGWYDAMDFSGYPKLTVNRNRNLTTSAEKNALESAVLAEYTRASAIGVFADFENVNGNTLDVIGTVKTSQDVDNADYSLTFVITEDNVGPYMQLNNYSGGTGCPEWADKDSRVSTVYNDVARNIHADWNGIKGSVPTTLKAGEAYTYRVKNMSMGNIDNVKNVNVIALLIDNKTGYIANADLKAIDPTHVPSGVEMPALSEDAERNVVPEFYTLDGVRLDEAPARGVYLEKRGAEVVKKLAR